MIVLAAKSYAKSALSSQLSSAVSRCGCDDLARLLIGNNLFIGNKERGRSLSAFPIKIWR
jgi:hypothetical protein